MTNRLATVTWRDPNRSANAPATLPNNAPTALNIDRIQAEATKPTLKSSRNNDRAGGTFPICIADTTPASTSIQMRVQSLRELRGPKAAAIRRHARNRQ